MTENEKTLGDSLAEELYTRILIEKFEVVGAKIEDYYLTTKPIIDIPEFMKPFEEQIAYKTRLHLIKMYEEGSLDYWYRKALYESEI